MNQTRHPAAPPPEEQIELLRSAIARLGDFDGTKDKASVLKEVMTMLKRLENSVAKFDSRAFPNEPNALPEIREAYATANRGESPITGLRILMTAWEDFWR